MVDRRKRNKILSNISNNITVCMESTNAIKGNLAKLERLSQQFMAVSKGRE